MSPSNPKTGPGRTAADLEWRRLLDHLAGLALGDAARARLRAREPMATLEGAQARCLEVRCALTASTHDAAVPAVALPDLGPVLDRLSHGATLSAPELLATSKVLAHARLLQTWVRSHGDDYPALGARLQSSSSLRALADELERAVDDDGTLSDRASPELRTARSEVRTLRSRLADRLSELVRRHTQWLSHAYSTERDGRPVLPVRADAHSRVPGIVLGSSASGRTLFVEPREATEMGNGLRVALARVEREEERVLAALSALAAQQVDEISQAHEACVVADELTALVRWAGSANASVISPDASPRFALQGMRHPLLVLQGDDVVANDLVLEQNTALVISGPNAGGKTVALKCLGLAAWMARAAIPIPAEPDSVVGWFEPVLTDIGDAQSLMHSLSTFSAHVSTLAEILTQVGDHSLVLLDEALAGTDPEEGAALAVALLEELVSRGATVVTTTHYERLKERAAENPRFANASVGLHLHSLEPTFQVHLGSPGPSSALTVAARFGVPEAVIQRAHALVPEHARRREHLLSELAQERERLTEERRALSQERADLNEDRAAFDEEQRRAADRERNESMKLARQLAEEVQQARGQLATLKKTLQHTDATPPDLKRAERTIDEAAHLIAIGSPLAELARPATSNADKPPPEAQELAMGTVVFLKRLGVRATVVQTAPSGELRVLAGSLKLWVKPDELEAVAGQPPRTSPRKAPKKHVPASTVDGFIPLRVSDNTLDLRGTRVEDALTQVDQFVDELLRRGERAGYVLHGHGTGVLKTAVRRHLPTLGSVTDARPAPRDDGGDAFTLFRLDR